MPETRICGKCGLTLSAYAPPGLCANCMLQQGFDPLILTASLSQEEAQMVSDTTRPSLSASSKVRYFGDYELLKEIARGGMGVVYEARQVSLKRVVALKMILAGQRASLDFVQRFHREAESAAQLDHPHIVPIYEIGEHEGQQYFSMKLIDGPNLAQEISGKSLSPRRAAQLLSKVARAVHYAHQRGILHRDLKPGNILLDGKGEPHVTDFGLAKIIEQDSGLTQNEAVIGSPAYMSPEQATGQNKQLTTVTDVYSLGVVLYELLTGQPPFHGKTALQTMHRVVGEVPERPRVRKPDLDPDIETICLKCLEKDPQLRYGSAEALADDLDRWLRYEPILARPSSAWEATQKWMRRNPVVASLGVVTVLLLVAITAGSLVAKSRIAKARQKAEENLYAADMHEAETALEKGDLGRARKLIETHRAGPKETDLRGFEWRLLWRRSRGDEVGTLPGHANFVRSAFFNPGGDLLASCSADNILEVWDLATRRERFTIKDVTSLGGFSADGNILAFSTLPGSVKLCEASTGLPLKSIENAGNLIALLDEGKTVVTTGESFLAKGWDAGTGEEKFVLPGPGGPNPLGPEFGLTVSISADGKHLAVIDPKFQGITIWDLPAQKVLTHLHEERPLTFLQFSRDGKTLATGSFSGLVNLWDVSTSGGPFLQIQAHRDPVVAAGFSPQGNILATASEDQTVKLWDLATGAELDTLRGHESGVWAVAFFADGKRLASGGLDQTIKIWDLDRQRTKEVLTGILRPLAWSPDSTMLAAGCNDGTGKIWDAATLKPHHVLPGVAYVLAFSRDGKTVSTRRKDGRVVFWEVATGKVQQEVLTHLPVENWFSVAVSPDRKVIGAGYVSGAVGLCEISSGKSDLLTGHQRGAVAVIFSPDSGTLVSGDLDGVIKVWDVARRQCTASFTAHTLRVVSLAFSPDGRMFASGSTDRTIKLWDLKSKRLLETFNGHMRAVWALAFAPDGTTLASGSGDRTVRLWSVPRQRELATFTLYPGSVGEREEIMFVEFSPDGNNLATITRNGTLKLLRASPFSETDSLTSRR
jgi:WD40 repeat protein/predicted Ser/Thr protein kinase